MRLSAFRALPAIAMLPILAAGMLAPDPAHAAKTGDVVDKSVSTKGTKPFSQKPEPKKVGPKSEKAATSLRGTTGRISQLEDAGGGEVRTTPDSGSCTGSQCTQASNLAGLANNVASGISSAASQRLQDALDQRQQLLQSVSDGVGTQGYTQSHANELLNLIKENPRPSDDQIGALHENLQDSAHALRTNQQEIDYLHEKKEDYAKAAGGAAEMGKQLSAIKDRATSFGNRAAPAITGGGGARYPTANFAAPGSGGSPSLSDLAFAKYGDNTGGSKESGSPGFEGKDSGDKAVPSSRAPASTAGTKSGKDCAPAKDGKAPSDCAGEGGKGDAKDAKAEDAKEKQLSEDGKKLLAGMLQELKTDIDKAKAGIGPGDVPTKANGQPDGVNALLNDESKKQSLLGGAILEMTSAAQRSGLRAPFGMRADGKLSDSDYLGIDKDIFKRVHECIQRRSGVNGL